MVSDEALAAAIAAYGTSKTTRPDPERLRRAIDAAVTAAFKAGYLKGVADTESDDTGNAQ